MDSNFSGSFSKRGEPKKLNSFHSLKKVPSKKRPDVCSVSNMLLTNLEQ